MGAALKSVSSNFRNRKNMYCVEPFDHFIYFSIPFRVCWQKKFENPRGRSRNFFQNVSLRKEDLMMSPMRGLIKPSEHSRKIKIKLQPQSCKKVSFQWSMIDKILLKLGVFSQFSSSKASPDSRWNVLLTNYFNRSRVNKNPTSANYYLNFSQCFWFNACCHHLFHKLYSEELQ